FFRMRNTLILLTFLILQTHGSLGNPYQIQCIHCDGATGQQYFQHPSDCTKFLHCSPSGPQEKQCGGGTVWDQQLLTCNHATTTACVVGAYTYAGGACQPTGKPGQCPPVRPECPPARQFIQPPNPCTEDAQCSGSNKCCYDICLTHNTCKPPL
ncbi:unnamed protein product, partial [Meganyctiphanes norvegica]